MIGTPARHYRLTWSSEAVDSLRSLSADVQQSIMSTATRLRDNYSILGTMLPDGATYELNILTDSSKERTGYIIINQEFVLSFIVDKRKRRMTLVGLLDLKSLENAAPLQFPLL